MNSKIIILSVFCFVLSRGVDSKNFEHQLMNEVRLHSAMNHPHVLRLGIHDSSKYCLSICTFMLYHVEHTCLFLVVCMHDDTHDDSFFTSLHIMFDDVYSSLSGFCAMFLKCCDSVAFGWLLGFGST